MSNLNTSDHHYFDMQFCIWLFHFIIFIIVLYIYIFIYIYIDRSIYIYLYLSIYLLNHYWIISLSIFSFCGFLNFFFFAKCTWLSDWFTGIVIVIVVAVDDDDDDDTKHIHTHTIFYI